MCVCVCVCVCVCECVCARLITLTIVYDYMPYSTSPRNSDSWETLGHMINTRSMETFQCPLNLDDLPEASGAAADNKNNARKHPPCPFCSRVKETTSSIKIKY